jgi:MoaA/NifB/PqqE/SkfB family radical SAM enzyme
MADFVTLPHITPKEKAFFSPANHERVTQIIKAGRCVNCLKDVPPVYLNIDITWRCNYNCIGCIDGGVVGREEIVKDTCRDMSWEMARDLLDYARRYNLLGFIIQGGEPLLYPHIDDFLGCCAQQNLILRLVTNGSQLTRHLEYLIPAFRVPKSVIRVSINANAAHYVAFTRVQADLGDVLKGIEELSKASAHIVVGTVVFGKNIEKKGITANIGQIEDIFSGVSAAGAQAFVLLPGRHPQTKEMVPFEKNELDFLHELSSRKGTTKVILGGRFVVEKEIPACDQVKNYIPCPTALLRIVVGSDGRLFNCTEHRGEPDAEIGRISRLASFLEVWHSEQRVRRQLQFDPREHCSKITCDRHGINATVETARRGYEEFGVPSIIRHVLLDNDESVETFF